MYYSTSFAGQEAAVAKKHKVSFKDSIPGKKLEEVYILKTDENKAKQPTSCSCTII